MIVAHGTKSGSIYVTTDARGSIAVVESKEDPNLWHQRLGHRSSKGLKIMQSNRKLPGLRSADFDLYESCIFGKQKRISFKRVGRTPKEEKLELVHTDVWGPASV
ncbi:uncharacterized protein LOC109838755 [Asparagus officinalis]|uniref:uncharacterized protein LOC109838755 n=1 Tax=Asparagus officinalis TaxID=4686 RepID=UPI00098E7973|nr:uncharacterized protein LOC109838755 [Asparagus officinalis]